MNKEEFLKLIKEGNLSIEIYPSYKYSNGPKLRTVLCLNGEVLTETVAYKKLGRIVANF